MSRTAEKAKAKKGNCQTTKCLFWWSPQHADLGIHLLRPFPSRERSACPGDREQRQEVRGRCNRLFDTGQTNPGLRKTVLSTHPVTQGRCPVSRSNYHVWAPSPAFNSFQLRALRFRHSLQTCMPTYSLSIYTHTAYALYQGSNTRSPIPVRQTREKPCFSIARPARSREEKTWRLRGSSSNRLPAGDSLEPGRGRLPL
jgi:hypothetical protein